MIIKVLYRVDVTLREKNVEADAIVILDIGIYYLRLVYTRLVKLDPRGYSLRTCYLLVSKAKHRGATGTSLLP